jgi:hypothetical protein
MIYVLAGFGFAYLSRLDKTENISTYAIKPKIGRNILLILALILGLNGIRSTYQYLMDPGPENIRPLVRTLSASFQPEDRIYIYYGASYPFRYYYRSNEDWWIFGLKSRQQPDKYFQQLDEVLSQPGRVWMIFSHCHADECELIPAYSSKLRNVELMSKDDKVWLYLAY